MFFEIWGTSYRYIAVSYKKIYAPNFFQFLGFKTLDPDWIRIRFGIQSKMLDLGPYQMNTDPKHWTKPFGLGPLLGTQDPEHYRVRYR